MNKMIKLIRSWILLILLSYPLLGVGEAGAIFLLIAPGAAAQGTGEANVASVQDAYSSYYNPASLAFQEKTSFAAMHVNWLKSLVPDLYYEYLGFSIPYGDIGGIGGHFIFLSLGEQIATNELGDYIGEFASYMWAADISFGTKLTDNSALGLGFKVFHQKLSDEAYSGGVGGEEGKPFSTDFAFDLSYLYKLEHNSISENILSSEEGLIINGNTTSEDKFRFGFNIANIGPKIGFIDEAQADPAPTNMRMGIFANLFSDDYIKFNMLMDVQKLLVTRYPSMDWNGDREISGANEFAHDDPWYIAWVTAWLDAGLDYPLIDGHEIVNGLILPETQNLIYFDCIEDIYYGQENYCDFQLGMTGLFSFLMGYELGLPPLFNIDSGDPGIGVFGLMDYGSYNGRGVIPSLPSPWTKSLIGWTDKINYSESLKEEGAIFLDIPSNGDIFQFDVGSDEYFLIENRNNYFSNGDKWDTIDSLVLRFNDYESYDLNWFDAIIANNDTLDIFTFNDDSIITSVSDYNLGLPGSGILIWHINEPTIPLDDGINNDRHHRAVHLEEADGAVDIGYEGYHPFFDPTSGTRWDMWYSGNEAYEFSNNNESICVNENYENINFNSQSLCLLNDGIWYTPIIFDKYSNPNSNLDNDIHSFLSLDILS